MFRILDRHVLFEWLEIFAIVTGATTGLLLLQALYDSFRDLLDFGASTRDMLLYYLVLSPSFLSLVLPISVLVSLLYSLGKLHRNNEIIAMRAAGLSVFRLTRWIWVAAAVLSGLLFYLNSTAIPWSVEQARFVHDQIEFAAQKRTSKSDAMEDVGLVTRVGYHNRDERRVWFISRFSEPSHRAYGVNVSELDERGREVRRVVAAEAFWDEVRNQWEFLRGQDIRLGADPGDVQAYAFDRRVMEDYHEDPEWMLLLEQRPKDLSFFELRRIINSPESAGDPRQPAYQVRYHALLAGTFSCLIVAGLAVPFAVSGVRVNPVVGVSKSIGLFFLYFLLAEIGALLGEQGTVEPAIAAWLPNGFMACLAVYLLARTR